MCGGLEDGDIGTITDIEDSLVPYQVTTGNYSGWLHELDLELYEYTFEDFKKAPVGTKVTFESGEIMVKYVSLNDAKSESFKGTCSFTRNYDNLRNFKDNWGSSGKIIKIEEPTYFEVYNNKEEVKEMTLAEVCKELGYDVKIVKKEEE